MNEPAPPSVTRIPEGPADRLDSWKDIATYLKRDVSTVQRWEKREGMPVHRHLHDKLGSVYAFRLELDAWSQSRSLHVGREDDDESAPSVDRLEGPADERRVRVPGPALDDSKGGAGTEFGR